MIPSKDTTPSPFDGKYREARVKAWQAAHNFRAKKKAKRVKKIANESRRRNRK